MNGALASRDARSAPNTVHDRARTTASGHSAANSVRRPSSPKAPHHHHSSRHPSAQPHAGPGSSGTAKETFLNYFFGQNGPGPLSGATVERVSSTTATAITPVGRDVSGGEMMIKSGLGRRTLEGGSSAAFDMKSLGKHIEAVSVSIRL